MAASIELTTTERVKERLGKDDSVDDAVIATLVTEASSQIEEWAKREFIEETRTEYYDGTGTNTLYLRQGPLVSVTTVSSVEYGGTTARTETLTTVEEAERLDGNLLTENHTGLALIRLLSGVFTIGMRNYKVVYVAGFSTDFAGLPEAVKSFATSHVCAMYNAQRTAAGLQNRTIGDADINPIPIANIDSALMRAIAPYRVRQVA